MRIREVYHSVYQVSWLLVVLAMAVLATFHQAVQADELAPGTVPTPMPSVHLYLPQLAYRDGTVWRQIGGDGQRLVSVALDVRQGVAFSLYAASDRPTVEGGGLYGSAFPENCGAISKLDKVINTPVAEVYFDGLRGVAGTVESKLYYLDANRTAWKMTESDVQGAIHALIAANGVLYAGGANALYSSAHSLGAEWNFVTASNAIHALATDGVSLFFGVTGEGVRSLLLSTGDPQAAQSQGLQGDALVIRELLTLPSQLLLATKNGVYARTSAGAWEAIGLQGYDVLALEKTARGVVAGVRDQGVWMQNVNDQSWSPLDGAGSLPTTLTIYDLLDQPTLCGGALFAASENGLWVYRKE